jgi:hypothetical protein
MRAGPIDLAGFIDAHEIGQAKRVPIQTASQTGIGAS